MIAAQLAHERALEHTLALADADDVEPVELPAIVVSGISVEDVAFEFELQVSTSSEPASALLADAAHICAT